MKKPPELKFGPKRLREWAAEIAAAIESLTPQPGIGTTITEDPNGGGFSVNVKTQSTATAVCLCGCNPCAGDVAATYELTTTLGIFADQPIVLQQNGSCSWQWIGDAQVSVDYDALGPDTITLACGFECTGGTIPGWNIFFSPWSHAFPAGAFRACYDGASPSYPTGSYDAGDFTIA